MLSILLLGFSFSVSYLQEAMQWLAYLDPLRYFLMIIFDHFLKDSGVLDTLLEYGMMALQGAVTLLLSTLRVH